MDYEIRLSRTLGGVDGVYHYKRIDLAIDAFYFFVMDNVNAPHQYRINFFVNGIDKTHIVLLRLDLMKKYFKGLAGNVNAEEFKL